MSWLAALALGVAALAPACQCRQSPPGPPTMTEPGLQVLGDSHKQTRAQAPPLHSPWFDGERVELRAVRGEILGLQILLHQLEPAPVDLVMDSPSIQVASFEVGYLEVSQASSALYGPSMGTGSYPDVLHPKRGPVRAEPAAFFDLAVARDAAPGRYQGRLSVGRRDYPVELEVLPVAIDIERSPLVWVWYKSAELAAAHGLVDGDTADQLAVEQRYVDLFRQHGALLATDLPIERLRPRMHRITADIRYWPVWIAKRDIQALAADVKQWIALFEGSDAVPFGFTIDEPSPKERGDVRAHGLAARAAGAGYPRFLYAVTDQPRPEYRDAVDAFVSPQGIPRPDGWPDEQRFWTYNGRAPSAGNMTIDKPGTALRTWGWIAWRYRVELWMAWEGLYYTDRYNGASERTDLLTEPITYDERRRGRVEYGNGDGVLVYPGPWPSLRLKALRRGLQDRLLLAELARCGAKGRARADHYSETMVPRALGEARGRHSWPDAELPWQAARASILDDLASLCGAATP